MFLCWLPESSADLIFPYDAAVDVLYTYFISYSPDSISKACAIPPDSTSLELHVS